MAKVSVKPNKAQQEWMERITQFAQEHYCFPNRVIDYDFQRHHVVGRTYVQNKVPIGHWFILPIAFDYHDPHGKSVFNVTHFRKRYTIEFGSQVSQFIEMCEIIKAEDGSLPFSDLELNAIKSTNY